jgi:hypothetical protein
MLNFNENKVTIIIFVPITVIFILFMHYYMAVGCAFFFILALFRPPGSGSMRPIECGSRSETLYTAILLEAKYG